MDTRQYCLLVICLLSLVPGSTDAQPILSDAIAIVTDPVTLEREVPAGTVPFQVHVVYLNNEAVFGSVAAIQFGLELDPGLSILGATSNGIVLEPAPGEYVIAYPDCGSERNTAPFNLLSVVVGRDASAAPGAGIRLVDPASLGEPIRATRCGSHDYFFPINFGGVIVDPDTPLVAGFASSPRFAVEGRDYELAWDTVGSGHWLLDGNPVETRGTLDIPATTDQTHHLSLGGGVNAVTHDVELIREPRVIYFDQEPTANPGEVRVSWNVAGAVTAQLSGVGHVPIQSSRLIQTSESPVIEISASNEWGETWQSIELAPAAAPPVIRWFALNPEDHYFGQTILLEYDVEGATEIVIEPEFGAFRSAQEALHLRPTHPRSGP